MERKDSIINLTAEGHIAPDATYTLTVTGLPNMEAAKAFAISMAAKVGAALQDAVGGKSFAGSTETNIPGGEQALDQAIEAAGMKDDCQCPGCRARRADWARQAEAGSDPSTMH